MRATDSPKMAFLGFLGALLGARGDLLGFIGALLGSLGVLLDFLGALLGSLGLSWGSLGSLLGLAWPLMGSLGALSGSLGAVMACQTFLLQAFPGRSCCSLSELNRLFTLGGQQRYLFVPV